MSSGNRGHDDEMAQAPPAEFSECDDAAAAGDWGLFQRRCAFVAGNALIDARDRVALKRRFCLAYLGHRAQAHGGVYMGARPSVFTPAYVERMAADNASQRFSRYPWLERLIGLLQQLDQDQYVNAPQQGRVTPGPKRQLHVVTNTQTLS